MAITYYVVVPFGRGEDGDLVPMEPLEAQNSDSARRKAQSAAGQNAGAIAFSRTGDPDSGEFGEATILASFGDVDATLLGE